MKRKVILNLGLLSLFSITPLCIVENDKNIINQVLYKIAENENQNIIFPIAKVDTLYPVKTIRKVTNNPNALNVLLLGDNYAADASDDQFSNIMKDRLVDPWLSTTYPKSYDSNIGLSDRGVYIPYQTFLADKINVYSIQPNWGQYNNINNSSNTFFGIYYNGSFTAINERGIIKLNVLQNDFVNNFLEEDATTSPRLSGLIRYNLTGRANAPEYFIAGSGDGEGIFLHEMGHSIFQLSDEYDEVGVGATGPNRAWISDPNDIESIPWKEFLNFRGVGVYKLTKNPGNWCIPTNVTNCKMGSGAYTSNSDFCEVCTHHIVTLGAKILQEELFYIADPQLTISEGRPDYTTNYANLVEVLEKMEVFDFNVSKAKNNHLDFRTVVDNQTTKPKNIKLRVTISGDGGFTEESEIYNIQPGVLKGLAFTTTNVGGTNLSSNRGNKIIGEVIDADTNEILATSYDRMNYSYYKDSNFSSYNIGNRLSKITINFMDKATNQPIPNISSSTIVKCNGTSHYLENILFNGYKLDEEKTFNSYVNREIKITKNNEEIKINYWYDKLPSKNLILKLVDENDNEIQSKLVKVYEGQKFIPKQTDFFLYDLANYNSNNENANWKSLIQIPELNSLSYNEIMNNGTTLTYKKIQDTGIVNDSLPYQNSKIIELPQGSDIDNNQLYSIINHYQYNVYNWKYERKTFEEIQSRIIYNDVNEATVGDYRILYLLNSSTSEINNKNNLGEIRIRIRIIPNHNPTYTPNLALAEANRLNKYSIYYMEKFDNSNFITMNDFESINENNLLNNINNFALNTQDFIYEIINFNKNYYSSSASYKFQIKITDKTNNNSNITKTFEKYIWFDETPIFPDNQQEIENEINRINNLSLSLKNNTMSQEEINQINKDNILQNVNNWTETINFAYEVINFSNVNNSFRFNIKIYKNNLTRTSKEFILSYTIKQDTVETEEELLNKEINRINNLSLSLLKSEFSQEELDAIDKNNFKNLLYNWSEIESNSNKYQYEITNFNKSNDSFSFKIKITLLNDLNIYKESRLFNLNYSIVNDNLENEKNKINNLNLTLIQDIFTQEEIKNLQNDPNLLKNYIQDWFSNEDANNYNYDFKIQSILNNQIDFWIEISEKNNPNLSTQSNLFSLNYQQDLIPSNNLPIILSASLAPSGIAIAATVGTMIYKKKKRRY